MTKEQTQDDLECRAAFEHWYSNGQPDCPSIVRSGGIYRLMQAQISWEAWKVSWGRALTGSSETREADWQPIETCPDDGTWVLLCDLFRKKYRVYIGRFFQAEFHTFPGEKPSHLSHWMPLPAPPTALSAEYQRIQSNFTQTEAA